MAAIGIFCLIWETAARGIIGSLREGVLVAHVTMIASAAIAILAGVWFLASAVSTLEHHEVAKGLKAGLVPLWGAWPVWSVPVVLGGLAIGLFETVRGARGGHISPRHTSWPKYSSGP